MEKDVAIVKICVNSVLLLASLIGLYAAAMSGFNSTTINTIINIIIITIILENNIITNTNCSLRIPSIMAGKACLLLPYIILEFLQLIGFGGCIVLAVRILVMVELW